MSLTGGFATQITTTQMTIASARGAVVATTATAETAVTAVAHGATGADASPQTPSTGGSKLDDLVNGINFDTKDDTTKIDTSQEIDTKVVSNENFDTSFDTRIYTTSENGVNKDDEMVSNGIKNSDIDTSDFDTTSENGIKTESDKNESVSNSSDTVSKTVSNFEEAVSNSEENVTDQNGLAQTYYETMYSDASGVISLCTITQPKDPDQRGSLRTKGFYDISGKFLSVHRPNGYQIFVLKHTN